MENRRSSKDAIVVVNPSDLPSPDTTPVFVTAFSAFPNVFSLDANSNRKPATTKDSISQSAAPATTSIGNRTDRPNQSSRGGATVGRYDLLPRKHSRIHGCRSRVLVGGGSKATSKKKDPKSPFRSDECDGRSDSVDHTSSVRLFNQPALLQQSLNPDYQ